MSTLVQKKNKPLEEMAEKADKMETLVCTSTLPRDVNANGIANN